MLQHSKQCTPTKLIDVQSIEFVNNNNNINDQNQHNDTPTAAKKTLVERTLHIIHSNLLPLLLTLFILLSIVCPTPFVWLAESSVPISKCCIGLIFCLTGFKLKLHDIAQLHQSYQLLIFGLIQIMCVTPLLSQLYVELRDSTTYIPHEIWLGLALFCCMPTTVSGGMILTQEANGSLSTALALTVFSDTVACFYLPVILPIILIRNHSNSDSDSGADVEVPLDTITMLLNMVFTILLPLIIGKLTFSNLSMIRRLSGRFHTTIHIINIIALVTIPAMQVATSLDKIETISIQVFMINILLCIGTALIYISYNFCSVGILYLIYTRISNVELRARMFGYCDESSIKAIVICSSQKTMTIALAILNLLPNNTVYFGSIGLLVVPVLTAHFAQTFIGSIVANTWRKHSKQRDMKLLPEQSSTNNNTSSTHNNDTELMKHTYSILQSTNNNNESDMNTSTDNHSSHHNTTYALEDNQSMIDREYGAYIDNETGELRPVHTI